MADYIYLLQTRLTPAQRRAMETLREAARAGGAPVFLVGGAVRDLTSGIPVRDLDFAVQGEVAGIVTALEGIGAEVTGTHEVLGSTYLSMPGGVRLEVGPTLQVSYPKPGEPQTQSAGILEDLRRRDFTANAMAVSLNEGSFGLLLDPLNGIADLENRELRLASNYGFIEQPALLLRAARLSGRLGWTLEERTQTRYSNAKEENLIGGLPTAARGLEAEELFHEEDPVAVLEHMDAEGWLPTLIDGLAPGRVDGGAIDAVRDLVGQLEALGISVDPSAVYFPILTAKLAPEAVAALKQSFARPGFVRQIETIEARGKELAGKLTPKTPVPASDTWKLLQRAEPEVVLWLAYHSRSTAVQAKLKAFLKEWPQARQKVPYALMQEMRITPEVPGYDELLENLFFAMIDGKLETTEALRAFLEPYSPPAPVQPVSVRRRPAKAARGRGKKAVEEASLPSDEAEEPEEDDRALDRDSTPDEDEEEAELKPMLNRAILADQDEADDVEEAPLAEDTEHEDDEREAEVDEEVESVAAADASPAPAAEKPAPMVPTPRKTAKKQITAALVETAENVQAPEVSPEAAVVPAAIGAKATKSAATAGRAATSKAPAAKGPAVVVVQPPAASKRVAAAPPAAKLAGPKTSVEPEPKPAAKAAKKSGSSGAEEVPEAPKAGKTAGTKGTTTFSAPDPEPVPLRSKAAVKVVAKASDPKAEKGKVAAVNPPVKSTAGKSAVVKVVAPTKIAPTAKPAKASPAKAAAKGKTR